jgi:predicted dehydrogenase
MTRVAVLGAGRIGAMHAEILSTIVEPGTLVVAGSGSEPRGIGCCDRHGTV